MGRELQKKKNRSGLQKVRMKPKSKKRHNPKGNAIIAANWDQELTLAQNYKKLGLVSKLNTRSGGVEKSLEEAKAAQDGHLSSQNDPLTISKSKPTQIKPTEVRVERDPETGAILRVVEAPQSKPNPLNDPLNDLSESEEEMDTSITEQNEKEPTDVVKALEHQATLDIKLRPRQQSTREEEWIERLVDKYGDDYQKMARDKKLNPNQQTSSDIARRVKKWQVKNGMATK